MKTSIRKSRGALVATLVIAGLVLVSAVLWTHSREGHGHDAHQETHAALSLDNGKRWKPDAPLQTGMQRIRDSATTALAAHAQHRLTSNEAKSLFASMQENTTFLMQNCKLAPKADATLHVFITDLLRGSALLADDPTSEEGASLISESLRRYPEYFDHPGWVQVPSPKA